PRPDGASREPAAVTPVAPDAVAGRRGGAARSAGHRAPRRSTRSRPARAPLRLGVARVRGDRAADGGHQPVGGLRHAAWQGKPAADGADGRPGAPLDPALPQQRAIRLREARRRRHAVPEPFWRPALTSGALGHSQAGRATGGTPRLGITAYAAPLVREPFAGARRRSPLGAGHARPRGHLDDADLHASLVARRP